MNKKAVKKPKLPIRPQAILISSKRSLSYAEIQKWVKTDSNLGENVNRIPNGVGKKDVVLGRAMETPNAYCWARRDGKTGILQEVVCLARNLGRC